MKYYQEVPGWGRPVFIRKGSSFDCVVHDSGRGAGYGAARYEPPPGYQKGPGTSSIGRQRLQGQSRRGKG